MASPELDTVLKMIRDRSAEVRHTIEDHRLSYERIMADLPIDDDITTEKLAAGGVSAEWIDAPNADKGTVLLYLHGGGYAFGSIRTHRAMLAHVSRAAAARVLGLDYRLAPEFPFPAPVEDSVAAYRWLLNQGVDPKKIVIGGLMVSALVALKYYGEPMPAAGVGISSWADMEATGQSFTTNAELDPSVNRERILTIAKIYLADKDPTAPLASPIHADLTGLPPLLLQVGSIETLLDDTNELAKRAKAAGVQVEVDVWDDMPHVWHHFAPILPEARQAIGRIGEFMKKHTG
jgi:acetyl esterase/lipase